MRERLQILKSVLRRLPGVRLVRRLRELRRVRRLRGRNPAEVFTSIYEENSWNSSSVSGLGSELRNTQAIMRELPPLLRRFEVTSLLDVPCGDFNWMQHLDLGPVEYIGGDIVAALIERNRSTYPGVRFEVIDLLEDNFPPADLILCRDCLVHLSFEDIRRALENFSRSGARYLLTTTFTDRPSNSDIVTGQWRPLSLSKPPFSLPPPLEVLAEDFLDGSSGEYSDKVLALWDLATLRDHLSASGLSV